MIGKLSHGIGDRGFSFLRHENSSERTFVHKMEFERIGIDMPSFYDTFEFDVVERQGRTRAVSLRRID